MERLSARAVGTVIAVAGLCLAAVHMESAVRLRARPALVLVEVVLPLILSLVVVGGGVLIRQERLVPPQFAGRVLAWSGVGVLALSGAIGWLFLSVAIRGELIPRGLNLVVEAATMGTLVGLVVGVYDARSAGQQVRAEQLTRINDTLRIATREVVDASDRDELETAVCERLTESDIYDSAWIGRYTATDQIVRPSAWSGHDDEYIESLTVTVDPDDPNGQGPGGRAIRTREIQAIHDVRSEPRLEPWWDALEEAGVESMAVVPLLGMDCVHGFLSIYANRANVFDDREQEVLSDLGESIGHAIDAITARERLTRREQELARQNQRLDEFASVVSHDLRNPLNVAQGNVDLARKTGDDQHLDRADDALDRMDDLIDDLLTLARSGRTVSDVEPVDLRRVVEDAWSTTDAGDAQLEFDGELGTVRADESRLVQLFENLFRNSVEHGSTDSRTESGDSVEHGSTNNRPRADDSVEHGPSDDASPITITVGSLSDGFYVADDGRGIPESEREHVFETGYTTATSGTGFGLNIVRTIADAHGWRVAVTESAEGGARFEFTTDGTVPEQ